jgi:DNA-binding HxlR family transcriptional regulator
MMNHLNTVTPESVVEVLSCKWMPLVLERLAEGMARPGQLRRAIPGLSTKVLYERLHRLEEMGLVASRDFDGYPRRVEYQLTPLGRQVHQMILAGRAAGLALEVVSEVMKCRWLCEIMALLSQGPYRTNQIKRRLGDISNKVLAEKLRKLEELQLIDRHVSAERPLAVWYRLSEEGDKLRLALITFWPRPSQPKGGTGVTDPGCR